MEYTHFIEELRPLLEEARSLFNDPQTHEAPKFRKWRHGVTTLISAIEGRGHSIDCNISSRLFAVASFGGVTRKEQVAAYNRDLQDTINELESVVRYFEKYGDPKVGAKKPEPLTKEAVARQSEGFSSPSTATLKEKFESHPVVWGLTLLALGFGAGFAARSYFPSSQTPQQPTVPVNCRVEGADRLEETHHLRVDTLQKQLMKLEASASDHGLIGSFQNKYKEAADRVRQDIAVENTTYQVAIQQLAKTCQ